MKTKKDFQTKKNAIPDGEGLNALPIAFVCKHVIAIAHYARSNLRALVEIASS